MKRLAAPVRISESVSCGVIRRHVPYLFQAYMVAPSSRACDCIRGVRTDHWSHSPAYMIPYGVSTLFYGLLSDRLGRRRIMLASLLAFVMLTPLPLRHSLLRS